MIFEKRDVIGIPHPLGLGASPSYIKPNIFNSAFSVYGLYDYVGSGNAVVRLRDSSATPTEKDFTEAELGDGTFTSWLTGSTAYVAKFYDQKGTTAHDLVALGSSNQAPYVPSTNEVNLSSSGYFQFHTYNTTGDTSAITDAFQDDSSGNNNESTMVMSARMPSTGMQDLPASGRSFIGMRDGTTPSTLVNSKHRGIMIKSATYSTIVQLTLRGDSNTLIQENDSDAVALSTSLKTYAGDITRLPVNTNATVMDLWVDGTQEIDATATNGDAFISIAKFQVGNNKMRTQGFAFFNKRLTAQEHTAVHTAMSANY